MREGQCWQGGSQGGPARVPGSSTFRITMNMMITMMANDNDDEEKDNDVEPEGGDSDWPIRLVALLFPHWGPWIMIILS